MAILSPDTWQFICAHRTEDVRALALQARKYPQVDMAAAVVQIAGWQIAEKKVPLWAQTEGVQYPAHLSMEQCSSEITARYKASWLQGDTMTDLTGGLGVDCSFLAQNFRKVDYVERQEVLCELARHNFPLLGLPQVTVHCADGVEYLQKMEPVDCLFLDPARRDSQRKDGGHCRLRTRCAETGADVGRKRPDGSGEAFAHAGYFFFLTGVEIHPSDSRGSCE